MPRNMWEPAEDDRLIDALDRWPPPPNGAPKGYWSVIAKAVKTRKAQQQNPSKGNDMTEKESNTPFSPTTAMCQAPGCENPRMHTSTRFCVPCSAPATRGELRELQMAVLRLSESVTKAATNVQRILAELPSRGIR